MLTMSDRGTVLPASPIRKLAPLSREAQARGVKVFGLNIGQPDLPTPPAANEALHSIDLKVLAYSASEGTASLRSKMAEYYHIFSIPVTAEDILITCGGSEAILFTFLATLNPGDEVILPEPAYANYISMAITAGAKIVGLPCRIDDGFALPPIEDIEKLITPRTKAVLVCNPNNPTGYIYSDEEMEKLRTLVKKHDLFLFSDEVYREFCYKGEPPMSALRLEGVDDNVVVFDSVSKRYNECGIRIGSLVTKNEKLRATVLKFAQARLSPPLIGQIVAEASIDTPEEFMVNSFKEYERRRDFLVNGLNEIPGVFAPMPQGAFYAMVQLPVDNAEEFCKWCLREFSYDGCTVFMAPAAGFYITPGMGVDQVRMAYVLEIEELAKALEVLRHALEAYPGTRR